MYMSEYEELSSELLHIWTDRNLRWIINGLNWKESTGEVAHLSLGSWGDRLYLEKILVTNYFTKSSTAKTSFTWILDTHAVVFKTFKKWMFSDLSLWIWVESKGWFYNRSNVTFDVAWKAWYYWDSSFTFPTNISNMLVSQESIDPLLSILLSIESQQFSQSSCKYTILYSQLVSLRKVTEEGPSHQYR